jgi:hypothetical protein
MPSDDIQSVPQLPETLQARRGHRFYPTAEEAAGIPRLYATEDQPTRDKVLHLHYFVGGCDWWIAEYDPLTGDGFGYACLGDPGNAEWGYASLVELEGVAVQRGLLVVERDLDWKPRAAREVRLPGWRAG